MTTTTLTIGQDDYFSDIERVIRARDKQTQNQEYVQIDSKIERRREVTKIRREKEMKKILSMIGFICTIAAIGLSAITEIICACVFKMEFYTYLIAGIGSVLVFGIICSCIYFKLERKIKGTFEALIKAYDRA